jgi:hypothetical protein
MQCSPAAFALISVCIDRTAFWTEKELAEGISPALGKMSIVVHQWIAKQFRVDRQSFKQEDNIL